MRFYEKLPKLRKNNNFSQEQLADKLGVSRQAVSKWEMGSSYPDMDKMLQICKVLNCNLEDLMDDGVLGENILNPKTSKVNFNTYMKDFLNFITKSYNMFCSMKVKEKIKLIFEMACICMVLLIIGLILSEVLQSFISHITGYTKIGWVITDVITSVFSIIFGVIGLIIELHLFKIRYLDYFITIEDQNVTEKTIEEPIEKKEDKYYQEKPKEKIIIRDAKHSTFRFFDFLGKIILVMMKVFAIMCVLPIIGFFVFVAGCTIMGLYHIQYGILFLWIAMLFLGIGLLSYIAIEWVYNFISTKKQHLRRIFIVAITGLSLIAAGIGLSICTYLSYDKASDFEENDYLTEVINLPVENNTLFSYVIGYEHIIIDNTIEDIQVEVKYININDFSISTFNNGFGYKEYCVQRNVYFTDIYKFILNDLKNKKTRNYADSMNIKLTVTMSQKTYDKLQENQRTLGERIYQENYSAIEERLREEMNMQNQYYLNY